jgi:Cu/Ag efflux protein CusF
MLKPLVCTAAILALIAPPVMAQTMPTPPPAPAAPGAPGAADPPAPRIPSPAQDKLISGPVKTVDPAAKTVQVGWFLGLFRTTLEVTEDTHIAVEGTNASLLNIREGDRVKASYEARDGKNIAKSIEVMPVEAKGRAGTSSGAPASPTSQ